VHDRAIVTSKSRGLR